MYLIISDIHLMEILPERITSRQVIAEMCNHPHREGRSQPSTISQAQALYASGNETGDHGLSIGLDPGPRAGLPEGAEPEPSWSELERGAPQDADGLRLWRAQQRERARGVF